MNYPASEQHEKFVENQKAIVYWCVTFNVEEKYSSRRKELAKRRLM